MTRQYFNKIIFILLVTLALLLSIVLIQPRQRVLFLSFSMTGRKSQNSQRTTTTTPSLPRTILEVGLPRSGSLAIHNYFKCQGQSSLHYCCDSTHTRFPCPQQQHTIGKSIHTNALLPGGKLSLFDQCGETTTGSHSTNVFTAMAVETSNPYGYFLPQHFALPLLYQDNPKAVWILPLRKDTKTWATSVLHWHSETQRFLSSFGLQPKTRVAPVNDQESTRISKGLQTAVEHAYDPKTHTRKQQQLQGIYDAHVQKVREFAHKYHIRLIEINVDDPHVEQQLKQEFPSLSRSNCWSFDAATLDDDWKNLTLPF